MTRRTRILHTPIAVATVGILLVACAGNDGDASDEPDDVPSSQSADSTPTEETSTAIEEVALPEGVLALPAPDAGEDYVILEAGRYRVPLSDTLAFEVDLPRKTEANNDGLYLVTEGAILKVEAAGVEYGVLEDPCTGSSGIAPAGPTVGNLVTAIRHQPIISVSRPEPVEIGGAPGQYVELRVPRGYDASSCTGGQVGMPGNPGTNNDMAPGYVGPWWILDVDGQRVVVQTFCDQCDADASKRATRMVRNITFTSAP
jgi:hypothetical protein